MATPAPDPTTEEPDMKDYISKNCITYTEIDRWLFLSITIIVLLILILVFIASMIVNKGQKNRVVEWRNFLDFDGFIILAFYFPLCLAFCYLWRTVSFWLLFSHIGWLFRSKELLWHSSWNTWYDYCSYCWYCFVCCANHCYLMVFWCDKELSGEIHRKYALQPEECSNGQGYMCLCHFLHT